MVSPHEPTWMLATRSLPPADGDTVMEMPSPSMVALPNTQAPKATGSKSTMPKNVTTTSAEEAAPDPVPLMACVALALLKAIPLSLAKLLLRSLLNSGDGLDTKLWVF